MRICFIGPAGSAHLVKWCRWFAERGHELHVISFTPGEIENAEIHLIDLKVDVDGSDLGKWKYLMTGKQIRKLVQKIQPDVVNVHYATSYGIAAALSGVRDYVLSVWGSDIYDFPRRSPLHRAILKYSLRKARCLFSTSQAMADEAAGYTNKPFAITPFGVDMDLFCPEKRSRPANDDSFVIGTVKSLSDLYGIEYILRAAAHLKKEVPEMNLKIRICGSGPQEQKYREMAEVLGIKRITTFPGRISQEEAAREWANMDVAVIPSVMYESFGVAAVEAQACGTPVIISDVDGLKEATSPGRTSIVTSRGNDREIADAILKLYQNPELRSDMGSRGRAFAQRSYELNACFERIESLLKQCCLQQKK